MRRIDLEESNQTRRRVLWVTQAAVLVALLITLQWATAGTQVFAGQYITGSVVNCVLAISVLFAGLYSGLVVAVLSPFFAFLFGIGPKLLPIVPCIALGNVVYVAVLYVLLRRQNTFRKSLPGLLVGAVSKFLTLYLAVVQILIPALGNALKAPQIKTFTVMFSWPQLMTALLGGVLALLLLPILKKAIKNPKR